MIRWMNMKFRLIDQLKKWICGPQPSLTESCRKNRLLSPSHACFGLASVWVFARQLVEITEMNRRPVLFEVFDAQQTLPKYLLTEFEFFGNLERFVHTCRIWLIAWYAMPKRIRPGFRKGPEPRKS